MSYNLQDLEEEAVKLREKKKPVTDKAQLLLQALSVREYNLPCPDVDIYYVI